MDEAREYIPMDILPPMKKLSCSCPTAVCFVVKTVSSTSTRRATSLSSISPKAGCDLTWIRKKQPLGIPGIEPLLTVPRSYFRAVLPNLDLMACSISPYEVSRLIDPVSICLEICRRSNVIPKPPPQRAYLERNWSSSRTPS